MNYTKIKSVKKSGTATCHDITNHAPDCLDGQGNFIIDNKIVHNCIPTYVARRNGEDTDWMKDEHPAIVEILAHTNGVICFEENTLISLGDGYHKPIKEIIAGDFVHSVDLSTRNININKVECAGPTTFGDGIKITLTNNFSIIVTPNHRVPTYNSTKLASELDIEKDVIAIPNTLPHIASSNFSDGDSVAKKCAIMLGDLIYYRIKSIEKVQNKQFYNLSVANDHTVIANGMVMHQCYQEDLASIWQRVGGFTSPEAQAARKAVAKKWVEKLKPVRQRWIDGAKKELGEESATRWWDEIMAPFGRYSFNKCLSKDTLITDHETGKTLTIEQWYYQEKLPTLLSDTGDTIKPNQCIDIYHNGQQEVFLVELEDGTTEQVTLDHQFKCEDGQYHTVRDIYDKRLEITKPLSV